MGNLYLLFKTDDIKRDIVAAHESSEAITEYLKNDRDLFEPKKLGQGWEISLLMYDKTGKANLIQIKKYTKKLVNCNPEDIREGIRYNIIFKCKGMHDCRRLVNIQGISKAKCIKTCPPEFIFGKQEDTWLRLYYDDIVVITECREDEEGDDWDRFQYYSHLYRWKKEHEED